MQYILTLSSILAFDFIVIALKIHYANRKAAKANGHQFFNNGNAAVTPTMPTGNFTQGEQLYPAKSN